MPDANVNILGVGATLMGDDGAGVAALEMLSARPLPPGVTLYDAGLAVSDVLGDLDPNNPLIVIDAFRAGGEPGTIYKVNLTDMSLEGFQEAAGGGISLHEISVIPALRIEAMTGRHFRDVTAFGIEPERIQWGQGLSAPVTAAMDRLIEAVLQHVESLCCSPVAGDKVS